MKIELRTLLAAAGLLCAGGVIVYELRWIGRSSLAWVIIVLGAAVCLVALANLLDRGKDES